LADLVDNGARLLVVEPDNRLGSLWIRERTVVVLVEKFEGWRVLL